MARHAGISELVGDVLVSNQQMLGVTAGLGPVPRASGADRGVLQIRIPPCPAKPRSRLPLSRERAAERQSLRPLFMPSAVAVVGASRTPGAVGHEVVRALQAAGFPGRIYPVNPAAENIAGCRRPPPSRPSASPSTWPSSRSPRRRWRRWLLNAPPLVSVPPSS